MPPSTAATTSPQWRGRRGGGGARPPPPPRHPRLVAGVGDGAGDRAVVEVGAADGQAPGGEVDVDARDPGHLADLFTDGQDAVAPAHAVGGVAACLVGGGGLHSVFSYTA